MPIISDIKQQVKRKERYSLFLDGDYCCSFDAATLASLRLKKGRELTPADVDRLKKKSEEGKARDRALRLLGRRAHSTRELERKLRQKQVPAETVAAVLADLKTRGYLDDSVFAGSYVRYRQGQRPRSPRALRRELQTRGVPQEAIDSVVAPYEDEEAQTRSAVLALRPKLRSLAGEKDLLRKRKKLYDFLARQGYDYSVIRRVVDQVLGSGENEGEV